MSKKTISFHLQQAEENARRKYEVRCLGEDKNGNDKIVRFGDRTWSTTPRAAMNGSGHGDAKRRENLEQSPTAPQQDNPWLLDHCNYSW